MINHKIVSAIMTGTQFGVVGVVVMAKKAKETRSRLQKMAGRCEKDQVAIRGRRSKKNGNAEGERKG